MVSESFGVGDSLARFMIIMSSIHIKRRCAQVVFMFSKVLGPRSRVRCPLLSSACCPWWFVRRNPRYCSVARLEGRSHTRRSASVSSLSSPVRGVGTGGHCLHTLSFNNTLTLPEPTLKKHQLQIVFHFRSCLSCSIPYSDCFHNH